MFNRIFTEVILKFPAILLLFWFAKVSLINSWLLPKLTPFVNKSQNPDNFRFFVMKILSRWKVWFCRLKDDDDGYDDPLFSEGCQAISEIWNDCSSSGAAAQKKRERATSMGFHFFMTKVLETERLKKKLLHIALPRLQTYPKRVVSAVAHLPLV